MCIYAPVSVNFVGLLASPWLYLTACSSGGIELLLAQLSFSGGCCGHPNFFVQRSLSIRLLVATVVMAATSSCGNLQSCSRRLELCTCGCRQSMSARTADSHGRGLGHERLHASAQRPLPMPAEHGWTIGQWPTATVMRVHCMHLIPCQAPSGSEHRCHHCHAADVSCCDRCASCCCWTQCDGLNRQKV